MAVPPAPPDAPRTVQEPWDASANFAVLRGPLEAEIGLYADALNSLTLHRGADAAAFSATRATNMPIALDAAPAFGTVHYGLSLGGAVSGFFRVELAERGFIVRHEVVGRAYNVVVIPLASEPIVALRQAFGSFLGHVGEALLAGGLAVGAAERI